jgi:DNA-binding XRE family transcriptional regulator
MKNLQQTVTEYTKSTGITKDALAKKVGCGRTSFYMKLRGTSDLSLEEGYKLSRELGCTVDELCQMAGVTE